jgi:cytosine/adenosine deaminase-related metal-dependent hydrolase
VLGRSDCGSLAPGKRADVAIWDVSGIETAGAWDPVAALVFCAPMRVKHLLVEGKQVVRDGQVVTIDLPRLIARAHRLAAALRE